MNLPEYRAKKIDSEDLAIGCLISDMVGTNYKYYIKKTYNDIDELTEIDPSTLAIHFPDMLDSNNNPIFASLSESGKGGDTYIDTSIRQRPLTFIFDSTGVLDYYTNYSEFEIYGIQS